MIRSELYIYDNIFFDNTKIHVHFTIAVSFLNKKGNLSFFFHTSNNHSIDYEPFDFSSFVFYLVHSSLNAVVFMRDLNLRDWKIYFPAGFNSNRCIQ